MAIGGVNSQNINQASIQPSQNQGTGALKQGGLFKNQPASQPTQNVSAQRAEDALNSIDKLLNRVMDELRQADGATKAAKIIAQADQTKIAPNLAKDLQNLAKALQADEQIAQNPTLKELSLKLKEFLKPIADLKSAPLNEQLKNSGVMLEANLKEALNPQKLPASVQKLLSDIKNLSNQNLLNQIVALASDESLDTKGSFDKLNNILNNAKNEAVATLNGSPIKGLLSGASKLDDMAKFLDKLNSNITQNGVQLNGESIKMQMSKMDTLVKNLNSALAGFSSEKLNQSTGFTSNFREFSKLTKELTSMLDGLNRIGNEADLVRSYALAINADGESLQDKLQSAARRLAQTLNFIDSNASSAKANLDELKTLTRQLQIASNDQSQVENKSSAEISKSLSNDIKSTLLGLQEKSVGLNNAQQISQMTSKMLNQIELHQIVSSLSGGVQSYLPYVWDEVDGGKVAFKRGKKDKYYAQIDLNFKQYGQINILASLSEKRYIDISIATQQNEFKNLIKDNQKELKRAISELGLMVSGFSLKVMPKNEIKQRFKDFEGLEMGYDVRA